MDTAQPTAQLQGPVTKARLTRQKSEQDDSRTASRRARYTAERIRNLSTANSEASADICVGVSKMTGLSRQEQIRQLEAQLQFMEAQLSMFDSTFAAASADERALLGQDEQLLQQQLVALREELATLQQRDRMLQPLQGKCWLRYQVNDSYRDEKL